MHSRLFFSKLLRWRNVLNRAVFFSPRKSAETYPSFPFSFSLSFPFHPVFRQHEKNLARSRRKTSSSSPCYTYVPTTCMCFYNIFTFFSRCFRLRSFVRPILFLSPVPSLPPPLLLLLLSQQQSNNAQALRRSIRGLLDRRRRLTEHSLPNCP